MWDSLHSFLLMGGYAQYLWPAYGITLAILFGNAWFTHRQSKKRRQQFSSELKR